MTCCHFGIKRPTDGSCQYFDCLTTALCEQLLYILLFYCRYKH